MKVDVLVVGAGPAGSSTAIHLARAGARVLLADKARFPRDKPCGGGLTGRALKRIPVDPSPVVEFNERVTAQDNEACERVQRGVTSRVFDHGVFPAKDAWVHGFDERYRRDVEG